MSDEDSELERLLAIGMVIVNRLIIEDIARRMLRDIAGGDDDALGPIDKAHWLILAEQVSLVREEG